MFNLEDKLYISWFSDDYITVTNIPSSKAEPKDICYLWIGTGNGEFQILFKPSNDLFEIIAHLTIDDLQEYNTKNTLLWAILSNTKNIVDKSFGKPIKDFTYKGGK